MRGTAVNKLLAHIKLTYIESVVIGAAKAMRDEGRAPTVSAISRRIGIHARDASVVCLRLRSLGSDDVPVPRACPQRERFPRPAHERGQRR